MTATRMHDDEIEIDVDLVRRLIASQFPAWADLPIEPVVPRGTDNAMFRLGDELAARLPRVRWAADRIAKERAWLPRLAPHLPIDVPLPVAEGKPASRYPWSWSVVRWLEGEPATSDRLGDATSVAIELVRLIHALWAIDPTGGPLPEGRGGPLAPRDEVVRTSIATLADEIDVEAVTDVWRASLSAPVWDGPGVWIHGDLDAPNLLARHGRLTGVIDFGTACVGDPACDVMVAWKMLPAEARALFRAELGVDSATWARAQGWALSQALNALGYYTLETNEVLVLEARRWLAEVLADA